MPLRNSCLQFLTEKENDMSEKIVRQRNGIGKYLIPTGMVIITLIAIAGRFVCALERVRNTPTADTAAYTETDVVTEEPSALPEAPAAPTVNVQTHELVTTDDFVIQVDPDQPLNIPFSDSIRISA